MKFVRNIVQLIQPLRTLVLIIMEPYTEKYQAEMVRSLGVKYTIIGHSERRDYFNETNKELKKKVDLAILNDLKVIFC